MVVGHTDAFPHCTRMPSIAIKLCKFAYISFRRVVSDGDRYACLYIQHIVISSIDMFCFRNEMFYYMIWKDRMYDILLRNSKIEKPYRVTNFWLLIFFHCFH